MTVPRFYHCKRHDRPSQVMTFPNQYHCDWSVIFRDTSVCPKCLDGLRAKYRAARAISGPHGLFDGLPSRGQTA